MHKLTTAAAVAATVLFAGAFSLNANAAGAAAAIPSAVPQMSQAIHPAACRHPGPHCGWGHHLRCSRWHHHCWCAPC